MFDPSWIYTTYTAAWMALLTTLGIYFTLIVVTRLMGLRSFSKLSSFDFAVTVAIGSLLATVLVSKNPTLLLGVAALLSLYLVQFVLATLRRKWSWVGRLVDNKPLMVMDGKVILEKNLSRARMTQADLFAKLRESNVTDLDQVYAVVVESTGDVSVLHSAKDDGALNDALLFGVDRPD